VASTIPAHRAALRRLGSPAVVDVALALALFATTLLLLAHGGLKAMRPGARPGIGLADLPSATVLLAAASTLPLVAWRRAPVAVFAVTASASVGLVARGDDHDIALGAAVALYLVAAGRTPSSASASSASSTSGWSWTATTTAVVLGFFLSYLAGAAAAQGSFPVPELLHTSLAWAAAWFAGERTRLRHAHIAQLRERARRAEQEADRERRLAAAEERARIARDLHDSAGHAINVIAVRAGAARLRHGREPDRSLQALEAIEDLARQTAADIDHIVGTLRAATPDGSTPGAVEAPPGLASLDTLVARHSAAGLDVTVEPSGDARALSDPADQGAYRILQEALTNAARHGTGRVVVGVAYGDRDVELSVTNPVGAAATGSTAPRGGHGLVGMRERALLLGGELDAARVNGDFRVRARIPYAGPAGR
jgi:signal transduction histidine kinase